MSLLLAEQNIIQPFSHRTIDPSDYRRQEALDAFTDCRHELWEQGKEFQPGSNPSEPESCRAIRDITKFLGVSTLFMTVYIGRPGHDIPLQLTVTEFSRFGTSLDDSSVTRLQTHDYTFTPPTPRQSSTPNFRRLIGIFRRIVEVPESFGVFRHDRTFYEGPPIPYSQCVGQYLTYPSTADLAANGRRETAQGVNHLPVKAEEAHRLLDFVITNRLPVGEPPEPTALLAV